MNEDWRDDLIRKVEAATASLDFGGRLTERQGEVFLRFWQEAAREEAEAFTRYLGEVDERLVAIAGDCAEVERVREAAKDPESAVTLALYGAFLASQIVTSDATPAALKIEFKTERDE